MAMTKKVLLSAGHGNGDAGAVAQGTTEANETVQITDKVAAILRGWGKIDVVVQSHNVGSLVAEINDANRILPSLNAGYAIQIHKNSGGGTGSEVWYPTGGDAFSRDSATKIANRMAETTGLRNRGIKAANTNRHGKLGWTDDTKSYALLIEAGFIDVDPVHDDMDNKMAQGIARGIMDIFGEAIPAGKKLATVDEVKQAYLDVLERPADQGGINTYANTKFTVAEVRADLQASPEYKTKEANKSNFQLVGSTSLVGKKFVVIRDTELKDAPSGARAPVTGTLDYKVGHILENISALLVFKNGRGEERKFYVTQFWASKGVNRGFEYGSLQEQLPPIVVNPPVTKPEEPVVTPPVKPIEPGKDDEQDQRLSAIEATIKGLQTALKVVTDFLSEYFTKFKK